MAQLTGFIDRTGAVQLHFNAQSYKLLGPTGGHWLPCDGCERVLEVPLNVVAHLCDRCGAIAQGSPITSAQSQAYIDGDPDWPTAGEDDVDDGDYIAERVAERDDIPPTPYE